MLDPTRFGAFFRERREALGLSLREFCRRNGFDPGNTSRLERGKTKPPRASELLEAYAKALQLEPDSHDWRSFFDLAAAEAGRLPAEIAENQAVAHKLPEVFRSLRRERRREGTWTSAMDLESWADYLDARSQLPRLLRRLICATASLEGIAFPAGEGVQRPGWDGLVDANSGNPFVPAGPSCWECGVDRNIKKKANRELAKRTKNPLGVVPAQTSFVFVAPRKWLKKEEWCREKRRAGAWREVRAYDASDLEGWLEIAPAVDAWFARSLGRKPNGVTDADDHWEGLSAISAPNLKPDIFLASRGEEIEALKGWLSGPPSSLAFEARSPAEVLDFLTAFIASLDDAKRDEIGSRVVIVDREEAWQALASGRDSLALAAKPEMQIEAEMVAKAVRNGHHVLLSSTRFSSERTSTRTLPRCYRHDLEKALVASGFPEQEAARLARESGGSLTVLKRRISCLPSTKDPAWARGENAAALAPLVLIGAWNDDVEADRRILERITGRPHEEVFALANRWLNTEDAPVMRILSRWSLMSREDAWVMLGPHVTPRQLDAFEETASLVLGEDDPQVELESRERALAHFRDVRLTHSGALRGGLAETLALLGSRPDYVPLDSVGGENRAEKVVRSLLSGASWKRWASLSDHLPVLAEAAPKAFLEAVGSDLKSPDPQLPRLFQERGDPLFSSCLHAGLLWALEALAWSPEHLGQTATLLARLDEQDPGGSWANRPFNSLVEIFLPWIPHTTASVGSRIRVLRRLTERTPAVGWRLLLKLLPSLHGVSTPTHSPAWRDWAMDWSRGATNAEYWEQVDACATRVLEMVGTDLQRWLDIVETIEDFPAQQREELFKRLQSLDVSSISTEARKRIADQLGKAARRHRAYQDTRWALPPQDVSHLEQAARHFQPDDLVARSTWLFARWPEYLDGVDPHSPDEREERLASARQGVLEDVFTEGGLPRILELAQASEDPFAVGFEFARISDRADDKGILPDLLESDSPAERRSASGFARGRFIQGGWKWVATLGCEQWSPRAAAGLATALPSGRETWEWVESRGAAVKERYWRENPRFSIPNTDEDLRYMAKCLLDRGRRSTAIHCLAMSSRQGMQVDSELLMAALQQQHSHEPEFDEQPSADLGHHIQELFKALQSRSEDRDLERLARLEWAYLEVLDGHGASPRTLHRLLQSHPQFFADVLRLIFRSENDPDEEPANPTEDELDRARNAYELLFRWHTVPGTSEDGSSLDEDRLVSWLQEVRRLARDSGHLKVCDSQIGELFAHAPPEEDGSWPCIPVRDALDEIDTDEAERGFVVGTLNKRGAHWRSPFEGGHEERALAARYGLYAEACASEWPRAAAALRSIARHHEEDAKREDALAEARK